MAELATIARPSAEALYKAAGAEGAALKDQVSSLAGLAALAADAGLRQFADNPKVASLQVFDLIAGIALQNGLSLDSKVANLLRTVLTTAAWLRCRRLLRSSRLWSTPAAVCRTRASKVRLPSMRRSWLTPSLRLRSALRASSTPRSRSRLN